jgi:O-antigen/teichoic acid export membrane protein
VVGGLNAYVFGAVLVFLVTAIVQAVGMAIGARRTSDATPSPGHVSYRQLFSFGLPKYVGSLTTHFSYRIDTYVIAFMLANPSEPLGFYTMAVTMAEMVFIFPSAVQTIFFPHVAGSDRADANRQVAQVSRSTLLVSILAALFVLVSAALLFRFILPAFGESMQPLVVLLPAVVALSVSNVTEGYVTGIGRPGVSSAIGVVSFVVNLVANLLLIPRLGIVGAATASLISYTLSSVLMTVAAGHFSGQRFWAFWLLRPDDVRTVTRMGLALAGRVWAALRPGGAGRGA